MELCSYFCFVTIMLVGALLYPLQTAHFTISLGKGSRRCTVYV